MRATDLLYDKTRMSCYCGNHCSGGNKEGREEEIACDDKMKNKRWLKLSTVTHTPWSTPTPVFLSVFFLFSPSYFLVGPVIGHW